MIKYILRKFGYVLIKKKEYDELIFEDSLVFESEEYKNKRRERHLRDLASELYVKHYPFRYEADIYLACRKAAIFLLEMEEFDWTK